MECFRLLFDHLAWIKHQFLSSIRDSRKAGSLWWMMRGVGGVRKSICCIVICWFLQKYTYIYWIHTDAMIKMQKDFFINIFVPLPLFVKVRKGLCGVLLWEGAGDWTEIVIFWPPLLWPSMLCLSRSPGLLNRRPRGPLCWVMAFFTASYQQLISNSSGPQWPLWPGMAFPTISYLLTLSPTLTGTNLTSVLTELYNSSTPTQLPTRFLKSHV